MDQWSCPALPDARLAPFGALRLGNQPFDRQNLRNNRQLRCRYRGEPACQLRIMALINVYINKIIIQGRISDGMG